MPNILDFRTVRNVNIDYNVLLIKEVVLNKKIGFGKAMNCPKCKHWCVAPYVHQGEGKYQCKWCESIFKKGD